MEYIRTGAGEVEFGGAIEEVVRGMEEDVV